jgi:hypothetical protein
MTESVHYAPSPASVSHTTSPTNGTASLPHFQHASQAQHMADYTAYTTTSPVDTFGGGLGAFSLDSRVYGRAPSLSEDDCASAYVGDSLLLNLSQRPR